MTNILSLENEFAGRVTFAGELCFQGNFTPMKTLPLIVFLTAFVAFVFSSFSLELSASLLFTIGLGCVLLHDYTRPTLRTRLSVSPVIRFPRNGRATRPALELAA